MYKVFLVEDEIAVRERIRKNIKWANIGLIFAGEASDGEMALPLIEEIKPDILITDIRMPFMDGLELSRIVKKNMPWVKIIILTGHDEFNFAKEAISVGITEYLLKPISSQDLIKALNKVAMQIEKEKMERENYENINKRLKSSVQVMKERFLNDLTTGVIPSAEAIEKAKNFDMNLIGKYYAVAIIVPEVRQDVEKCDEYSEYLKAESIISSLLEENEKNDDVIKFSRSLKEIVVIFKSDNLKDLESRTYNLMNFVKHQVESNTACLLTIGIGSIRERIQGISKSFVDAEVICKFNHIFSKNKVVGIKDVKLSEFEGKDVLNLDDSVVIEFLEDGNRSDINKFISNYIKKIKIQASEPILYTYISITITLAVVRFIEGLGGGVEIILSRFKNLEKTILNIDNNEKFENYLNKVLEIAFEYRESRKIKKYSNAVTKAKEFIDKNYSDPNISLNSVASFVNISPSHFSTIFSQETGETFIQYLTNKRISKAMEMLRTTNLKTSEIATKVGYNDSHYFSHIFKKTTGTTARQYRQNN